MGALPYSLFSSAFTNCTPRLITSVFEILKRSAHSSISANSLGANRISRRLVFLLQVGLPVLGDNFITSLLPVRYL